MPLSEGIALALAEYGVTTGRRAASTVRGGTYAGLSGRETDIVRLVPMGLADKQNGAELRISARTVDSHMRRLFAKLGVQSRAALASWAMQESLVHGQLDGLLPGEPRLQQVLWQEEQQQPDAETSA